MSLDDFSVIKKIGVGGFGVVALVKHKQTDVLYAIKACIETRSKPRSSWTIRLGSKLLCITCRWTTWPRLHLFSEAFLIARISIWRWSVYFFSRWLYGILKLIFVCLAVLPWSDSGRPYMCGIRTRRPRRGHGRKMGHRQRLHRSNHPCRS